MTQKFKVGVMGVGFIGPAHMESVRRLGFEVVALADHGQERADISSKALFVPKGYGNWQDMLADPEIDVIHIASPNFLHYEQAKAALLAGKHVICEKPLTINSEQSAELVKLARQSGLVNAVNFNLRFYPLVQEAKAMLSDGRLGDRIYIAQGSYLQDWLLLDTDWNWRLDPELGGELRTVGDIGSHWIDLVSFVQATRVKAVFADFETFIDVRKKPLKKVRTFDSKLLAGEAYEEKYITSEDYAGVLIHFENGARGMMAVSQMSAGRKNRLSFEINGSVSSLVWNSETPNELIIGHREVANQVIIKDPSLLSDQVRKYAVFPGGHAEGFPDTFRQLHQTIYDYIASGDLTQPADFPTFLDGHISMLVNEAIQKSAKHKRWVDVDYTSLNAD